jgi:murein DD-endopeptidase MepM/ murein hydrolase activator NlpD
VTVPDHFTALTLVPVGTGTFPFLGTDERYHVSYDLQVTNASRVPATLTKIDVVDGRDPTKVIASLSGRQLVDPACSTGDCNRLRRLPSAEATDAAIPPQESRALLIDFTLSSLAQAPGAVMHHLYGTGAAGPPAQTATDLDYLAAPFDISAGTPRVIGPPVKGKNWVALNGCCDIGWPHRTSLNSLNGTLTNSQRFAIDWKRLNDKGEFYSGDRTKNESYVDYGSTIYAVADGTVVSTLDDVDANPPGVLPATDPVLAAKLTVENVDGNHIVVDIGQGAYAMYAHLIKGTLKVKVGDRVKKGDTIAELGNTGNSNASHMHFQLMNGPSLLGADALPYVIDRFTYVGQVAPAAIEGADDFLTGTFLPSPLSPGHPRTAQLPSVLAIVDFPE